MERRVNFDDGERTTVESWGDSGPVVLCIHGITSSRKSWERTAAALADHYRVFAYDQRGHGDSAEVLGPMTLARSVADLRMVAHAIGEPASLIGHSWGGAVALLAGREPFARRVEVIDPMVVVVPGTWRQEYLDDTEADLRMPADERSSELRARLVGWHELDVAGKLHAMEKMRAESIARLGSENRVDLGGWDLRSVVADYPRPLLVLAAAPSQSVMSSDDLEFIRLRGGSNVDIQTLADQGHNLHRTAFERYLSATQAFLAK
jgi:pimeloyl-ACP methyl ester carboxylesterase